MVYRFPSGSIGLVSPAELQPKCEARQRRSVWQAVKAFFNPVEACRVTAVCVPPGARLKLHDLSPEFHRDNHVRAEEEVKFEQLTAAVNTYRDAVCFENGRKVRMQHLPEAGRKFWPGTAGFEPPRRSQAATCEGRAAPKPAARYSSCADS